MVVFSFSEWAQYKKVEFFLNITIYRKYKMIEVNKLADFLEANQVGYSQAILDQYAKDISFIEPVRPKCVVTPGSVDQLKVLVDYANQTLTPLIPVSSGPPHFKGDTVPSAGGAIIVDLSGFKKIIRIDKKNRVALVEPGVTFGKLIPALKKKGLRPNLPFVPRYSKSVVGSLLDRDPVIMPKYQWDIADPLSCIEFVCGSTEIFRTGAAAGPGTIEEQWEAGGAQKEAAGPLQASWYRCIQGAQGTMGIVTWASLRCEILPEIEKSYMIGTTDLNKLLEVTHWLIRLRLVNECLILNSTSLSSVMAATSRNSADEIKRSLPPWILFFVHAGYEYFPEERVQADIDDMQNICRRFGVTPSRAIGSVSAADLLHVVQAPSAKPYWKLSQKGSCQDIFCQSSFQNVPSLVRTMSQAAVFQGYPLSEMGVYLQPCAQGTSVHCEWNLFYDSTHSLETKRAQELTTKAVMELMNDGAFFSRPYGKETSHILNRDSATVTALKKVKKILDPNNIMNPGKLCF